MNSTKNSIDCNVVKVVFDLELKDYEVPAFRGAIIETVGRHHVAFHNHLGDDKFHYKYPVVQYKKSGRKASIICIKEGVEELHHFFLKNTGEIRIGTSQRSILVENVQINRFGLHVSTEFFSYSIKKWLPLHGENYSKYLALQGMADKVQFLERVLIGNILSMAKGLDWFIDQPIEVRVIEMGSPSWVKFKTSRVLCFDVDFKTNVFLPYGIGLGKSSSIGFGTIEKANNKRIAI